MGCELLRAKNNSVTDGEYRLSHHLYPDKTIKVYCHDMSVRPREYLTVNQEVNVAHWDNRRLQEETKCNDVYQVFEYHEAGHTIFSKVRLIFDKDELYLDGDDFTFAQKVSGEWRTFGIAGNCHGEGPCPLGYFKIDLTDTCAYIPELEWMLTRTENANVTSNTDRTISSAKCGGGCGECKPRHGRIHVRPTNHCNT